MSWRDYLKGMLPEAIVLIVFSSALSYLFSTAFYAGDGIDAALAIDGALCAVLTVYLAIVSYNKRLAAIGGVALGLVLLAAFGIALALGGGANVLEDTEGNLVVFVAVVALTCIGCFLLSRKRILCVLLVVGGLFAYGVVQYLLLEGHVAAFVVAVVSGMVLVMFRSYRLGLRRSQTRTAAFGSTLAFSALAAVAIAGIAVGVFYVIVQPLDPPAQDIKLITEYKALEELPRRGVNEELAITDPDMTSTVLNGEFAQADEDDSDLDTETDPDGGSLAESVSAAAQAVGTSVGYAADSAKSLFDLITFNQAWYGWLLLIILVLALLAAPVVVKKCLRRRFYARALALPPAECIETLYMRIVRNLGRMGVSRGVHATPYEFAYETKRDLQCFSANEQQADFMRVTIAFVRASFGEKTPTDDDMRAIRAFYEAFYKNSRVFVGTPKYLRLFFRL